MGKFDSVDRLMNLAKQKPGKDPGEAVWPAGSSTETAPEEQLGTAQGAARAGDGVTERERSATSGRMQPSAAERGRQIVGALRPLLPVVGGALGMVDHGAARAVSRLLPLLGGNSPLPALTGSYERQTGSSAKAAPDEKFAVFERRLELMQARLVEHEEGFDADRKALEKVVAEQDAMRLHNHELVRRVRTLSWALGLLVLLVIALAVYVFVAMPRS